MRQRHFRVGAGQVPDFAPADGQLFGRSLKVAAPDLPASKLARAVLSQGPPTP